jgi:homoserine kinase
MNTVTVKAPATIANLVCGFDIMGLCLNEPFDEFTVSISKTVGVSITNLDNFNLPTIANQNVCGVALLSVLKNTTLVKGFDIISNKKIMPGSGIGSSAASAAGVVVAANYLLGNIFDQDKLIEFALEGEFLASGGKHADNIAPAILGGITLIRSHSPIDIIKIASPELYFVILHPQIEIKTSDARKILPQKIELSQAIQQWANTSALVAGFLQNDYELIGRSLQDIVVEPIRSRLIPYYLQLKNAALQSGALGGGISGSGPSVFMVCKDKNIASNVEQAMKNIYATTNIKFKTYISTINPNGVILM